MTRIGALRIQVCNRKIGDDAFYALLNFIGDRYAGLVSDWNTATGYAHRQDKAGRNIPYIEFLLLKNISSVPSNLWKVSLMPFLLIRIVAYVEKSTISP